MLSVFDAMGLSDQWLGDSDCCVVIGVDGFCALGLLGLQDFVVACQASQLCLPGQGVHPAGLQACM